MNKLLYIMEGEIEERFVFQMQKLNNLMPGKRMKFNLMQKKIKQTDNIMTSQFDKIICILDTDLSGENELKKLSFNVTMLKQIAKSSILIAAQIYNFEDELKRMAGTNKLHETLNLKNASLKDIKKFLAQNINYSNMKNIDFSKYISKTNDFYEKIIAPHNIVFSGKVKFITSMEQCK